MAAGRARLGRHATAWVALEMGWSAGFVDLACYLHLRRLYTSHMSGNSAGLALHLAARQWQDAARYGWVVACFFAGLLISAMLTHFERREGVRSAFSAVLGLESFFLAVFIGLTRLGRAPGPLLVFLPAAAMGMQTVTVTRVGGLRVYTTYITGTLSKLSEAIAEYCFWFRDRTRGRLRNRLGKVLRLTPRQESARQAALTAGLWMAFVAGAVAGAAGDRKWGAAALVFPIVLLGATIIIDLRHPVALGEVNADEIARTRR